MDDREQAPLTFGKYLLDAELAQGGMSRVFDARLRGPGGFEKKLVVKQILPQLAQDPSFIELFVREANTLVQMSHPNIVPVYELGVLDGVYFLAMERVHGATVAELLRDGPLPEALVAQIGAQICEALRYAHERFGLVHRDVTPRNVMVDADGHVRLLDFGIAAPSAQTGHGELFGSPGYMSPEQAARRALGPASDMFALGAVLYEALSARRASERDPAGPSLHASHGTSEPLSRLVGELLAVEPGERPSAADAALALRTWLARNHPQGVERELGARAELACRRLPQPTAAGDSVRPPSGSNATPRVTRSIATSKTLSELLAEATEALPGRASSAAAAPATAPAVPARKRSSRVIALASGGAIASLAVAAVLYGDTERTAPRASTSTSTSAETKARGARAHAPGPPASASVLTAAAARPGLAAAGAPSPTNQNAAATPATAPTAGNPAAEQATAALSINATPWASVRLDGRVLGTTPQRALPVRAGNHVLLLDCPPLGRQARVPLKLAAGDHRRVLVDMQADPPAVTVH